MLKSNLLTVAEVAERLRVSRKTIYMIIKNPMNKLPWYNFPFGIRIKEEDLEKYGQYFKKN